MNTKMINYVPSHNASKHSNFSKLSMFLLIVSLGMGEKLTIVGIKAVYIFAIFATVAYVIDNKNNMLFFEKGQKNLFFLCLAWLMYALIQLLWAVDKSLFFTFYISLLINIFVIFIIVSYVRTFDDWMFIAKSFLIMISVLLGIGFYEIATGEHILDLGNDWYHYINKPVTVYGNGNDYASVLVLGLFVALFCLILQKRTVFKTILLSLLMLSSVYQLLVIESRSAILSVLLFAIVMPVFLLLAKLPKRKLQLALIFCTLLAGLILAVLFTLFSVDEILAVFSNSNESNIVSDRFRLKIIEDGLKALVGSAFLGVGTGQSISLLGINIHNFYLEIIVEYGIIMGFCIVCVFLGLLFNGTKTKLPIFANAIILVFPIVLIILGLASSSFLRIRSFWIFFSMLYILKYDCFLRVKKIPKNKQIIL